MSRNFYDNRPPGYCALISFKELVEAANMSLDEYSVILDKMNSIHFKNTVDSIFKGVEDAYGIDGHAKYTQLWNEAKTLDIDTFLNKYDGDVDVQDIISNYMQYTFGSITGIDIYEWKTENPEVFNHVTDEHIQDTMKYIDEMKHYTENVPIPCYQIWVIDGKKDEIGHVFITFYNTKSKYMYDHNNNLLHPILRHKLRLVEYVTKDRVEIHHGSVIPVIESFTGGHIKMLLMRCLIDVVLGVIAGLIVRLVVDKFIDERIDKNAQK